MEPVLVAGGFDGSNNINNVELFNPVSRNWTTLSSMENTRCCHTATKLNDGKVLVVGGRTLLATFLNATELFDPATKNWTVASSMTNSRNNHQGH